MNLVDRKYCGIVSTRVERFKVTDTNPYKANFRCPICGDSQKSQTKARGWLLEYPSVTMYHCHNCGLSIPFGVFLKQLSPALYDEYVIDTKVDEGILKKDPNKKIDLPLDKLQKSQPKFTHSPLRQLKKISSLDADHKAKKYVTNRGIPSSRHYKLYYAPKFNAWVNSFIPNKIQSDREEPRIVLPFIDKKGKLFGFQGRALGGSSLRYITIMIDETKPKIFGLDTVDSSRMFYVVEGPIDSLFLKNAIAMAGASVNLKNDNAVYVFDNEPRNKEICRLMEKKVESGCKVVVWPENITEKDINDMVLAGYDVEDILERNTYSGLQAELKLRYWRKC